MSTFRYHDDPVKADADGEERTRPVVGEEAEDIYDPQRLLFRTFDPEISLFHRIILTASIRNPNASFTQLGGFCAVDWSTVRSTLAAFWRGQLEEKGMTQSSFEKRGSVSDDENRSFDELTEKQQAIVDTFARYPHIRSREDWSWSTVADYICEAYEIEVSESYPQAIADRYPRLIEIRREELRSRDELPEGIAPELPEDVPEDPRALLSRRVVLPDENMDFPPDVTGKEMVQVQQNAWISTYRDVIIDPQQDVDDLDEADELTETQRMDDTDTATDDDRRTRIERGNAAYEGDAKGLDQRTRHLSEVWAEKAEQGTMISASVPAETVAVDDTPYKDALETAVKRTRGFHDVLASEFEKFESEHTAARLNTAEWILDALEDCLETAEEQTDTEVEDE